MAEVIASTNKTSDYFSLYYSGVRNFEKGLSKGMFIYLSLITKISIDGSSLQRWRHQSSSMLILSSSTKPSKRRRICIHTPMNLKAHYSFLTIIDCFFFTSI
ncbi:predicted protein [Arabidopsis lyrata subsp. lyrata]|uniref:Predicted protein n=1 Tax=Arabidopsis lyrata subsp. lyrata TaxID=81972 RepID=D7LWC9_ARALL|nr:predicted protein [Arabidopsis lyrata subsp. lyrata]